MLDGSVSWYYFGELPFSDGQRGLELAGLLHLCVICFHQTGMIAFKKLSLPLFAARIAPEPCVFVCACSVS
jgi:hypothetical protein